MIAAQAVYRTAAGDICASTDPDVAYLVCGVGAEVPAEYEEAVTAHLAPPVKQVELAENKQAAPAQNKRQRAPKS